MGVAFVLLFAAFFTNPATLAAFGNDGGDYLLIRHYGESQWR